MSRLIDFIKRSLLTLLPKELQSFLPKEFQAWLQRTEDSTEEKSMVGSLPQESASPSPVAKDAIPKMSGESYNSLFSTPLPTPKIFVDHRIRELIKHSLPENYVLPNPVTKKFLSR